MNTLYRYLLFLLATAAPLLSSTLVTAAADTNIGTQFDSCSADLESLLAEQPVAMTPEDRKLLEKYPSPFSGMPAAFFDLQNRYKKTNQYACCTIASHKLLNDEDQTRFDLGVYWLHAALGGDKAQLFQEYHAACAKGLNEIVLPQSYHDKFQEYTMRTGIFIRSSEITGQLPICAGIRLDTHRVLTAKHCFYSSSAWQIERGRWSREEKSDAEIGVPLYIPHDMRFIEFRNPTRSYRLRWPKPETANKEIYYRFDDQKLADESIVVHLKNSDDESLHPLDIRDPRQWDKLLFVTVVPTPELRQFIAEAKPLPVSQGISAVNEGYVKDARKTVYDAIRIDDSPNCYIWAISDEGCIFHNCQTLAGMSGSPLISLDRDEGVRLVGVHTGATDAPEKFPCGFTRGKWVRNFGSFPIGN